MDKPVSDVARRINDPGVGVTKATSVFSNLHTFQQ